MCSMCRVFFLDFSFMKTIVAFFSSDFKPCWVCVFFLGMYLIITLVKFIGALQILAGLLDTVT